MMKRMAVGFLFALLLAGQLFAFPRRVLIEEFTNASCGPCAAAAPAFNSFIGDQYDNISVVVTHAWWPGNNDPWYVFNTADATWRINYYGITGVPNARVDGNLEPWPIAVDTLTSLMNTRLAIPSPLRIDMVAYPVDNSSVDVNFVINSGDTPVQGNYKLRAALMETYANYAAPNGQTDWHYGLRDCMPSAQGADFEIESNSSLQYEYSFPWNDIYEADNLHVAVWVQNDDTQEVIQSQFAPVDSSYLFAAVPNARHHLVAPGGNADFAINMFNIGTYDDVIDASIVESNLPEGWSFHYTTPDGDQTENSSFSMAIGDEYTSTANFTTSDTPGQTGTVTMRFASEGDPDHSWELTFVTVTSAPLMVINQDPADHSSFYTSALDAALGGDPATAYGIWDGIHRPLTATDLLDVDVQNVFVCLGNGGTMSSEMMEGLNTFVHNGGNLFISGSEAPEMMVGSDLLASMGAMYQGRYASGTHADGVEDDPVSNGMSFDLGGGDGADNLGEPCSMVPSDGTPCFWYSVVRRAGIRKDNDTYHTVLLGFPFEAIADQASRNQLMTNVLAYFNVISSAPESGTTAAPLEFALLPNYPNPFNATTEIRFTLPGPGHVTLSVFNLLGQEVTRLRDSDLRAGHHTAVWNAGDAASGIYFCRLTSQSTNGTQSAMQKLILVK